MTSKKPGKSLAAAFGAFSASAVEEAQSREAQGVARQQPRVVAPVLVAAKRSIQDLREERDRFEALAAGGGFKELAPELIDPSPFADRLPDDNNDDFERFKATVRERGQEVPILVRVHPNAQERFQVVYGHRRLRATRELGIPVKALVCEYSDSEVAIAQGIENAERQNLSYIEQALFASHLGDVGLKGRDIRLALSANDADLSRFRRVLRLIPIDLVHAIGRAPRAGRTRWMLLSEAVEKDPGALTRVRAALSGAKGTSDDRFAAALGGALRTTPAPAAEHEPLAYGDVVIGQVAYGGKGVQMKIQPEYATAFAAFLKDEIPELMKRFSARSAAE